ncbi:MAG: tetratricopeptide repeat protein [Burkholderiaceae bacterium]
MKLRAGISLSLCGPLLFGCSILPSMSSLFDSSLPPQLRIVKTAQSEYERGKKLHRAGQYLEAKQAYVNALSLDPTHAEAKNGIAGLMGVSGDLDSAIALLEQLTKDHPAPHVYANLAYALELRGRDLEARDALQQALSIDPSHEVNRRRLQAMNYKLNMPSETTPSVKADPSALTFSSENIIEATGPSTYVLRYSLPASPLSSVDSVNDSDGKSKVISSAPADAQVKVPTKVVNDAALSVELINGNGVNGLAKQIGKSLPADHWRVVRTANYKHYSVGLTRIEYQLRHADDARRFSSMLGIGTRFRPNNGQRGTLRIILGHDCKNFEQLQRKLASALSAPTSSRMVMTIGLPISQATTAESPSCAMLITYPYAHACRYGEPDQHRID